MALYTIIKIFAGLAPKRYIDRHTIDIKKIIMMDLSWEKSIRVLGLMVPGACGLFFLGFYGVEGDFDSDRGESYFGALMFIGAASLVTTTVWTLLVIRAEIKRDQEGARGAEGRDEGESNATSLVTSGSSVWVGSGFISTLVHITICLFYLFTDDSFYNTIMQFNLPTVLILYLISLFGQPRRRSQSTMTFLRVHFTSFCWISIPVLAPHRVSNDESSIAPGYFLSAVGLTILIHYGLKIRASIGRLLDKELDELLVQ